LGFANIFTPAADESLTREYDVLAGIPSGVTPLKASQKTSK